MGTLHVAPGRRTDNAQDLELAFDVCAHFRLKTTAAHKVVAHVCETVRGWATEARRVGIRPAEIDRMAPAFRLA